MVVSGARKNASRVSVVHRKKNNSDHAFVQAVWGEVTAQCHSPSSVNNASSLPPNLKSATTHNEALKIFGASSSSVSDNGSA